MQLCIRSQIHETQFESSDIEGLISSRIHLRKPGLVFGVRLTVLAGARMENTRSGIPPGIKAHNSQAHTALLRQELHAVEQILANGLMQKENARCSDAGQGVVQDLRVHGLVIGYGMLLAS